VKVHDTRRGRKFGRTNAAAALNGGRVAAPRCYAGTATAAVFGDWFKTGLLPRLHRGSAAIPDNARFHRKTEPDKPAKKAGAAAVSAAVFARLQSDRENPGRPEAVVTGQRFAFCFSPRRGLRLFGLVFVC
jgi:hypothetical protein